MPDFLHQRAGSLLGLHIEGRVPEEPPNGNVSDVHVWQRGDTVAERHESGMRHPATRREGGDLIEVTAAPVGFAYHPVLHVPHGCVTEDQVGVQGELPPGQRDPAFLDIGFREPPCEHVAYAGLHCFGRPKEERPCSRRTLLGGAAGRGQNVPSQGERVAKAEEPSVDGDAHVVGAEFAHVAEPGGGPVRTRS
ncbi:MAG TPA: hypothetical protein VHF47_14340 [Acidimicrobiales bacterium]|nr:hypothetical protein [Acidimicrobiales bacterium]